MNPFDNLAESKFEFLDPYIYQLKKYKYILTSAIKPVFGHIIFEIENKVVFEFNCNTSRCVIHSRVSKNKHSNFGIKEVKSAKHLIRLLDYYQIGITGYKRHYNNSYGKTYSTKVGKNRYNNLNKVKQKNLEKLVREYIKTQKGCSISREKVASEYNVKLKFIDPIFNKLNQEGKIQKSKGRSIGALEDGMRHPTLWYIK